MEYYTCRAAQAAPSWVLPYGCLSCWFSNSFYQFDKAAQYLHLAKQLDSSNILVLGCEADYHYYQKQYPEAEKIALKIIEETANPDGSGGYYYTVETLVEIYLATGRAAKAEPILRQMIAVDSSNYFFRGQLGKCLVLSGKYAEAEREFYACGKLIDLNNPDIGYYSWMAYLYAYQDKMDKAFDALEKSLRAGNRKYDYMQVDPDYEKLRAQPERWKTLMKKYFPEKVKD